MALSRGRKLLIGLFTLDGIFGLLLAAGGAMGLVLWIFLNAIVMIPVLVVRRAIFLKRKRTASISIGYATAPEGKQEEKQYGSPQSTLNGERVRSFGEKMLADYFLKSGIRYRYEEPAWSSRGRRISRPDFYLPDFDLYVEYWGMADANEEYDRSMKWKMTKYHQNGIKFISIYRDNFSNLDWIFKAKLRDVTGIDLNKI